MPAYKQKVHVGEHRTRMGRGGVLGRTRHRYSPGGAAGQATGRLVLAQGYVNRAVLLMCTWPSTTTGGAGPLLATAAAQVLTTKARLAANLNARRWEGDTIFGPGDAALSQLP